MSKRNAWIAAACGALALASGGTAVAAPCAGFTDVDAASGFCANVEWLKNRAVTLGCTATEYCPGSAVSRLAMAAFMNRLGNALTPVLLRYDGAPGAIDLDAGAVVCVAPELPSAPYPRRAFVDASLTAVAPADAGLGATLVADVDAGGWAALNAAGNRITLPANKWAGASDIAAVDIAPGTAVRFGVSVSRGGLPGSVGVADSRCQLRALVYSRTGTASPY